MKPYTALERFEDKYIPEPNSGCWLWEASVNKCGYGQFAIKLALDATRMESIVAHRASWILFRGPIPPRMEVCHSCDIRSCVNPDHLWLGTHAENMADCARKGRIVCNPIRGSGQRGSKLTEGQVREIKTRGKSARQYAAEFGVRADYVHNIQSGRAWPHVVIDPSLVRPPREQTKEQARKSAYLREWKRRRALVASARP